MEQPEGYVAPRKKDWVWVSTEAGRPWTVELNAFIESEGFTATAKDPAIYIKTPGRTTISPQQDSG